MKFSIDASVFYKELSLAARMINKNSHLPILNNIMLFVKDNKLSIFSTDLETGFLSTLQLIDGEDCSITLPAKTLVPMVGSYSGGMTVEVDDKTCSAKLICGKTKTTIKGISAEDYPAIPDTSIGNQWSFRSVDLKIMTMKVTKSAGKDDDRPVLTSIYIETDDQNYMKFTTADGFRLSHVKTKLEQMLGAKLNLLVPAKAMTDAINILEDSETTFGMTDNYVYLIGGHRSIIIVRTTGNFPDYNQIIPKKNKIRALVQTREFAEACKRASIFSKDKGGLTVVEISNNELMICGESDEFGNTMQKMAAQVEGDSIKFGVNVFFVSDIISAIKSDTVSIELNDPSSPISIRIPENNNYISVVMPMMIAK